MPLTPRSPTRILLAALGLVCASCATVPKATSGALAPPGPAMELLPSAHEEGLASYYGQPHHGRRTASGERFDMDELTAAHRTLPFGTRVRVTNLDNGRSVVVRINDRGPWKKRRVIDVSYAAARKIGMIGPGTAPVRLDVLAAETTAKSSESDDR